MVDYTLAPSEMFVVTPSDSHLQIPPYAQAGPLKVLYNAGAEGIVSLGIKDKNSESGPAIAYTLGSGKYLRGVGDIYVVLATGTTTEAGKLLGQAHEDMTPDRILDTRI